MSILKPVYKLYEWYISRNLRPENMPKHIAIIMDGNRRFQKSRETWTQLTGIRRVLIL